MRMSQRAGLIFEIFMIKPTLVSSDELSNVPNLDERGLEPPGDLHGDASRESSSLSWSSSGVVVWDSSMESSSTAASISSMVRSDTWTLGALSDDEVVAPAPCVSRSDSCEAAFCSGNGSLSIYVWCEACSDPAYSAVFDCDAMPDVCKHQLKFPSSRHSVGAVNRRESPARSEPKTRTRLHL
mmetsp:Transcript_62151/g.165028  ORF Transcript_62151/g.165028 Transcript_62151/m.165028 type:complete len:183 (-) Transcript_62151:215-763(-)